MATAMYYGQLMRCRAEAIKTDKGATVQEGWLPVLMALAFDVSAIFWLLTG